MAYRLSAASAWRLFDELRNRSKDKAASDTGTARVTRVDGDGTAWVSIPGSDGETPVNGTSVANVSPGDVVTYRIGDGRLAVTGSVSDPAVGGRQVERAVAPVRETADRAGDKAEQSGIAAKAAQEAAAMAQAVAEAINQRFWADTNGAHVTSVPQEEWEDSSSASYHSGPNVLINSLGMLFRDGLNNLLALTGGATPGVSIYDGAGNADGNIVALFMSNLIEIGRNSSSAIIKLCGGKGRVRYEPSWNQGMLVIDAPDTGAVAIVGGTASTDQSSLVLNGVSAGLKAEVVEAVGDQFVLSTIDGTESGYDTTDVIDAVDKAIALGADYTDNGAYKIGTAGIDSYTNGPHVTVPAGTYVFVGQWTFEQASSTGTRNLQVGFRSGASGSLWGERVRVMAAAYNFAALNVSAIRTLSATTTVYLAGSSSKTTDSTANCYITAVRIK